MKKKKCSKKAVRIVTFLLVAALVCGAYALSVNFYVILSQKKSIVTTQQTKEMQNVDCVLVLGCGVREDGSPTHMLFERLKTGAEVFESLENSKKAKLLLSGDNSGESYNELAAMKKQSLENGVDESDMEIDNIGFSTYESLYNAKNIYNAKKIIIVTQPYHMFRALYIAKSLGMEAYGVTAYLPFYPQQIGWSLREVLARNKDFLLCTFKK